MKPGALLMPSHPPERSVRDGQCWDLGDLERLDAFALEYLADNLWFVGSPETVARRILDLQSKTGGFGHLTIVSYDAADERASWDRSLRLLMNDVLPRIHVATSVTEHRMGVGS
jgi:alkanesulfonate monooxygenase SsuD/methylene tetrahydromethanopterin reductase-like flavin-dependent oxidoreductase (luciferase family)